MVYNRQKLLLSSMGGSITQPFDHIHPTAFAAHTVAWGIHYLLQHTVFKCFKNEAGIFHSISLLSKLYFRSYFLLLITVTFSHKTIFLSSFHISLFPGTNNSGFDLIDDPKVKSFWRSQSFVMKYEQIVALDISVTKL